MTSRRPPRRDLGATGAGVRREPPSRTVVSARTAADLVAAIPYLVGFVPTRSLVLLSLRGERRRFGVVARVDLPSGTGRATGEVASAICDFVLRDRPREVLALVYDEQHWDVGARPWQHLLDAVQRELAPHQVSVRQALYLTGTRFWSYTCPSDRRPSSACPSCACCPPHGRPVHDGATSAVAAAYVLEGHAPVASREALVRRLAVRDPAGAAVVSSSVDAVLAGAGLRWHLRPGAGGERQHEHLRFFDEVAWRYVGGGPPLTVSEAVPLLVALSDVDLRDAVIVRWTRWASALPDAPAVVVARDDPDPADEAVHRAVTRLLVDLSVSVDGEPALAPLTLLAMQSWSCGDGAQAGVALDRVLATDGGYRLALLVDALLRSGLAPSWVGPLREEDESLSTIDPAC